MGSIRQSNHTINSRWASVMKRRMFISVLAAGAFTISPALRMFFAPNRATIFTDYLTGKPLPAHSNGTLGGRRTSE